jgi:hypothetical protein
MYELFQSTFAVVQSSSRSLVSLYDHLTIAPGEVLKFLKKRVRLHHSLSTSLFFNGKKKFKKFKKKKKKKTFNTRGADKILIETTFGKNVDSRKSIHIVATPTAAPTRRRQSSQCRIASQTSQRIDSQCHCSHWTWFCVGSSAL